MMKVNVGLWKVQFNKDIKAVLQSNQRVFQEACHILYERIKSRTPVGNPALWNWPAHKDYTPGTLKDGWEIDVQGDIVTIYNDVIYAERVENGWSSQAPAGMMRVSLKEFQSILDSVSRKV